MRIRAKARFRDSGSWGTGNSTDLRAASGRSMELRPKNAGIRPTTNAPR